MFIITIVTDIDDITTLGIFHYFSLHHTVYCLHSSLCSYKAIQTHSSQFFWSGFAGYYSTTVFFISTIFISQKGCFDYVIYDRGTPTLCVLQLPCVPTMEVGETTLPLYLARERAQSAIMQVFKHCTLVISK